MAEGHAERYYLFFDYLGERGTSELIKVLGLKKKLLRQSCDTYYKNRT